MAKINPHFSRLSSPYIFPVIEEKLAALQEKAPAEKILNFGIGDIALPLVPSIGKAISSASEEMGNSKTKRGYGPSEGYPFLQECIAANWYGDLSIAPDEIFISDGINSDVVHLPHLFALDCQIAIPNPTYPAYRSANVIGGRSAYITTLPCTEETGYLPRPPKSHVDLIYICSPNNPTGVALTREDWKEWIAYAKREKAIIIHDHAYAAFVRSADVPHSVYEIPGAKETVIECCSFSKTAGFTGLRCAWTVLPKALPDQLNALWKKQVSICSNGVAYPIQRGAEAALTEGRKEIEAQVASYMEQADLLLEGLQEMGHACVGGKDAPYIWWKVPKEYNSWGFFDLLLEKCLLIAIPGQGFGDLGEGYVRLSAFNTRENAREALNRIRKL